MLEWPVRFSGFSQHAGTPVLMGHANSHFAAGGDQGGGRPGTARHPEQ